MTRLWACSVPRQSGLAAPDTHRDDARMNGRSDDVTQILLAEYSALRAEAERRTDDSVERRRPATRLGRCGHQLGDRGRCQRGSAADRAAHVVHARQPVHPARRPSQADLTVYPGLVEHSVIGPPAVGGGRDQELAPDVARQRWFTATGWNALHPTRLAFQGVALLALVGALGPASSCGSLGRHRGT
jgi:hypothetical protein